MLYALITPIQPPTRCMATLTARLPQVPTQELQLVDAWLHDLQHLPEGW